MLALKLDVTGSVRIETESLLMPHSPKSCLQFCQLAPDFPKTPQRLFRPQCIKIYGFLRVDKGEQPAQRAELAPHLAKAEQDFFIAVAGNRLAWNEQFPLTPYRTWRGGSNVMCVLVQPDPFAPRHTEGDDIRLSGSSCT